MEQKTKIHAEAGMQDVTITREFNLPLELAFKAFAEPEIIEQWMSNPYTTAKVVKFEGKKHGSYQIQSSDAQGNIAFCANGVIHEFDTNKNIIRTFEMENTPYGVQLEVYEFLPVGDDKCKLNMHVIYESVKQRDEVLKLPFAQGISMAHNRIEEIMKK